MSGRNENTQRLQWTTPIKAVHPRGTERRRAACIAERLEARPRLAMPEPTDEVFNSAQWRKRWSAIRGMGEVTGCYAAGCTGSLKLGQILGCPWPKMGTAVDVDRRMGELNDERYGSLQIQNFSFVEEAGWSDWDAAKFSARPTHPASPVRVLARQLQVELPFWVTPQDFEALFNAALEPVALTHLIGRPAGRALIEGRGCTRDDVLRYSRSARGPVLATELASFGSRADAARLVTLVEWIVIGLVLADQHGRL